LLHAVLWFAGVHSDSWQKCFCPKMTKQGIFGKNDDFGTAIIGLTWSGLLAGVNSLKRLVRTTVAG